MLREIRCRNFRGFRELVAPVGPVVAFLGPNSSGKTTALQAVRIACELVQLALEGDATPSVKQDHGGLWLCLLGEPLGEPSRLLPLLDWRALFVNQAVENGESITIELNFDPTDVIRAVRIDVRPAGRGELRFDVRVRADDTITTVGGAIVQPGSVSMSAENGRRLQKHLLDASPQAVFIPPFYGTVREEEYRARAGVDRMLGTGDQSHVVRSLVAGLETEQFERLSGFLDEVLRVRLVYRTAGDAIQRESPILVRFRDTNGDLELSAAGAGLVNLVALCAALWRWRREAARRPVLFLLDEPEAHLDPRLQAHSTEMLARLVTQEFEAQILLATHSVDILNRLSGGGALLLRCDRTATPSVVALDGDSALFDDLARWTDLTPFTAINFLASRRVLFCEGADDEAVLNRAAEVRFRNTPGRMQLFRRWSIVRLDGASNAPITKLLARLVRNDVVRAGARDGVFRVIVALDRDYDRVPGVTTDDTHGVQETRVVWSRHSIESLFLEERSLAAWIRAVVGPGAPPDLERLITVALAAADADPELNNNAADQLQARLCRLDVPASGARSGSDERLIHAARQAREAVKKDPAVWQKGKDRARFVLQHIRDEIALPQRNQFKTDLVHLLGRADVQQRDLATTLPPEIADLLDRMVVP